MRGFICVCAALACAFLVIAPAQAHHSHASFYFMNQTVEKTGVVKDLKIINPHPELVIEVTAANGEKELWRVYATGTGTGLRKAGWNSDSLMIGETVKVVGHPPRLTTAKTIAAGEVTTKSGTVLHMGGELGVLTP